MKQFKLGTKILLAAILVLAVPLVVVTVVSVMSANDTITALARADLTHTATGLAEDLETLTSEQVVTASVVASSSSVITAAARVDAFGAAGSDAAIRQADRELERFRATNDERVEAIVLVNTNGAVFASTDNGQLDGTRMSEEGWFRTALKGTANVGDVVRSWVTDKPAVIAAAPIYDRAGDRVIGVAAMSLDRAVTLSVVGAVVLGETGYAYVVDAQGVYLQHPVAANILTVNITDVAGMESVAEKLRAQQDGVVTYSLDGVAKLASIHRVPTPGWFVVATVPEAELYASAARIRNVTIIISLVAILLAALVFSLLARSLTRPMAGLVASAHKVAVGDVNAEIDPATLVRQDEVGVLARAFHDVMTSLRRKTRIAEQIADGDLTVADLAVSESDTLGGSFATMVDVLRRQQQLIKEGVAVLASSGSEIMASVSQLTSSVAETSSAVSETTTAAEEVKQTTYVSSPKAQQVSELGKRSVEVSLAGQRSVEDTIQGIEHIREQVQAISDMVLRLSEQGRAIGEIIATVNDLAEQSNLLAVNASIEAAKAGEQGKGFGVVAQEIRSLASQSKQATAQVRSILFDVQKAISSAVMATEQGSKAVEQGVALSRETGEAMQTLTESVTEVTEAAVQIAAASSQQLIGMDQVVDAMEHIREAAIQMSAGTQQTEKTVHDLQHLSRRLQEIVDFYRV